MALKIIIDGAVILNVGPLGLAHKDNRCSNCPYPWLYNNLTLKNLFIVALTNSFVTNLTK